MALIKSVCVGLVLSISTAAFAGGSLFERKSEQVADSCLDACDGQYDTCQSGCRNISDTQKADECVKGCMRGYEGCKKRCPAKSGRNSLAPPTILACTQPPSSCESNSDCTCSGCCATLGEGGPKVCQPSC